MAEAEEAKNANSQQMEYSSSAKLTWKIENISKLNTNKLQSNTFSAGGHKWRILFFPKDKKDIEFSVYIEPADWETLPEGWSINAKFRISAVNVEQEAEHTFNASESCKGFSVHNPSFSRDYLANDACTVRAEVRCNEEEEEGSELNIKEKSDLNMDSSVFAEMDSFFTDIQKLLEPKPSEAETLIGNFSGPCSAEAIADAKRFLKRCLEMELSFVIQSERRADQLENSLATLLAGNAFPSNIVDSATKFLTKIHRRFEQYSAAKRDQKEAEEKEKTIGELKTATKQLLDNFMPKRKEAEAVDREIAELKVKKARLSKSLEDFVGEAKCLKQSLVTAEEDMKALIMKKEEAEKTVCGFEDLWKLLKVGFSE